MSSLRFVAFGFQWGALGFGAFGIGFGSRGSCLGIVSATVTFGPLLLVAKKGPTATNEESSKSSGCDTVLV